MTRSGYPGMETTGPIMTPKDGYPAWTSLRHLWYELSTFLRGR